MDTCIPLPSNMHLKDWEELIQSAEDARVVDFLYFGFQMEYEVPVLTPTSSNHSSAINYARDARDARDVDTYIAAGIKEEARLGLFHSTLFTRWCQVKSLLTTPQKGPPLHGSFLAPPPVQSVSMASLPGNPTPVSLRK